MPSLTGARPGTFRFGTRRFAGAGTTPVTIPPFPGRYTVYKIDANGDPANSRILEAQQIEVLREPFGMSTANLQGLLNSSLGGVVEDDEILILRDGYFLFYGVVQAVDYNYDDNGVGRVSVDAMALAGAWGAQRLTEPPSGQQYASYSGDQADDLIKDVWADNIGASAAAARQIADFGIEPDQNAAATPTETWRLRYAALNNELAPRARKYGVDYDIWVSTTDPEGVATSPRYELRTRIRTDRTHDNGSVQPVVFDERIVRFPLSLTRASGGAATTVLVGGPGIGANQSITTVNASGGAGTGKNRRETFVMAGEVDDPNERTLIGSFVLDRKGEIIQSVTFEMALAESDTELAFHPRTPGRGDFDLLDKVDFYWSDPNANEGAGLTISLEDIEVTGIGYWWSDSGEHIAVQLGWPEGFEERLEDEGHESGSGGGGGSRGGRGGGSGRRAGPHSGSGGGRKIGGGGGSGYNDIEPGSISPDDLEPGTTEGFGIVQDNQPTQGQAIAEQHKDTLTLKSSDSTILIVASDVDDSIDFTLIDSGLPYAVPAITLSSTAAMGSADTVIRSDATIAAFDSGNPADVGSAPVVGNVNFAARRDHVHRGVHSFAKQGSSALYGDVTISAGDNITLTQSGQDVEIAAANVATQAWNRLANSAGTVQATADTYNDILRIFGSGGTTVTITDNNPSYGGADTVQISSHSAHTLSGQSDTAGGHGHSLSGNSQSGGSHSHSISGNTGSGGSHTHSLSGKTAAGTSHSHSVSGTTGSESTHTHSAGGYTADTIQDHTHGLLFSISNATHNHGPTAFTSGSTSNNHTHTQGNTGLTTVGDHGSHNHTNPTTDGQSAGHTHSVCVSFSNSGSHSHGATNKVTDFAGGHDHPITGRSGAGSSHSHGSGTLTTGSESSHTHDTGTLTASSAGSHSHGGSNLSTSTTGSHTHGVGTYTISTAGGHTHGVGTYTISTS